MDHAEGRAPNGVVRNVFASLKGIIGEAQTVALPVSIAVDQAVRSSNGVMTVASYRAPALLLCSRI